MDTNAQRASRGIGRLRYFLATTAITAAMLAASIGVGPLVAACVGTPFVALCNASRLENLGMRRAWAWLSFVPIANWVLWVRCQFYPEGYAETRSLDATARVLIGSVMGLVVLVLALAIGAAIFEG